ncbi:DUF4224 domain-containing protein [Arsenophonus sp. PmNCSU2021_1]|uniref:DUF4224 domain-containing protein n=1 Tax=Arsenophonus sp. PmNCSU2021_1 TaxID=3118989 RepID=UPI002FF0E0E1
MSKLFLEKEEIIKLTKYKYSAYQKKWLAKRNIPFWEDKEGNPIIVRSYFLNTENNSTIAEDKPNFGAI